MAATLLSDVFVPDIWRQYVIERTATLSAVFQSGIVSDLNEQLSADMGGATVNMPFWQDLTGADEVIDDTANLTINSIGTARDVAAVLQRGKVFGASDLSGDMAGSDPMTAIGDLFAEYWARRFQDVLISVLGGAMGAASMTDNVLDISGLIGAAAVFDGEAFIDASARLGDHQDMLTAVAVHSATYTLMKKLDLIDFLPDSQGRPTVPTYMGHRVIVDDGLPVTSGAYTSYLFANGAIGYAEGTPKVPAAIDRDELVGGGTEYVVNRRRFVMHPRGIAWGGTPTGPTPTNAELATGTNWTRAYEPKNIRLVAFTHRVAAA